MERVVGAVLGLAFLAGCYVETSAQGGAQPAYAQPAYAQPAPQPTAQAVAPQGQGPSATFVGQVHQEPAPSTPVARAEPPPAEEIYRECDVFNGQVSHCGSWYQGSAVVYRNGAYRECDIFNGRVSHCGTWYRGTAVIHRDGAYRECEVFNGQVSHCGSWYRGTAALAP